MFAERFSHNPDGESRNVLDGIALDFVSVIGMTIITPACNGRKEKDVFCSLKCTYRFIEVWTSASQRRIEKLLRLELYY